jgi:hypothetical protein
VSVESEHCGVTEGKTRVLNSFSSDSHRFYSEKSVGFLMFKCTPGDVNRGKTNRNFKSQLSKPTDDLKSQNIA